MSDSSDSFEIYLINNEFEFHPEDGKVVSTKDGTIHELTGNANKMLSFLCQNYNLEITYTDIMKRIWEEKHKEISYGALYQTILVLRRALKRAGISQEIVKTVRRKGIYFSADIQKITSKTENTQDTNPSRRFSIPNKIFFKVRPFLFLLLPVLLVAIGVKYRNDLYIDKYTDGEMLKNNCIVHFNSDTESDSHHRRFINDHPEICSNGSELFITTFNSVKDIGIIKCLNRNKNKKEIGGCNIILTTKDN